MKKYNTIILEAHYDGKGITDNGASLTETVYCFLDHGNDPAEITKAAKAFVNYAFRKQTKMYIHLFGHTGEFGTDRNRFYMFCINTPSRGVVEVSKCDRYGHCDSLMADSYSKKDFINLIDEIVGNIHFAYVEGYDGREILGIA